MKHEIKNFFLSQINEHELVIEKTKLSVERNFLNLVNICVNSLKNGKLKNYENFINWDEWAKYFAISDLLETYHGALPRSVRFYYNPIIGKIDPISFDGHKGTGNFSNFILLDFSDSKPFFVTTGRQIRRTNIVLKKATSNG